MDVALADYVTRIQTVQSTRELWETSLRFFRACGVERASYHHYAADAPNPHGLPGFTLAADNFPEDWVAQYVERQLWRDDPIPARALGEGRVIVWSEALRDAASDPSAARFVAAKSACDFGDGLAVPLIGQGFRNGYAGLGFARGAATPSAQGVAALQAAAQMAHLAYCRIVSARAAAQVDVTPREREVLHWIARGKSTTVIAEILAVSRHTVDTLTRRLFDKLQVADRTSAALRGVALGLVAPPDTALVAA